MVSVTLSGSTATTGSTGNIVTGYFADEYTFITGAYVVGGSTDLSMRTQVSNATGKWFFTVINPNTGATVNNTSVTYKFYVIKIKNT